MSAEGKLDPKIAKLIKAWQTLLHNMIECDVASPADATSTMLTVAAYWRGENVGHHRTAEELTGYAAIQADLHLEEMADRRRNAQSARH